jgi:two-component system OmpR family sensor kinase
MSLRARLIVCLLVLAGAGLVTLAAVTYGEQKSFLQQRVDSQARAGVGFISVSLDRAGANAPGARRPVPGSREPTPEHGRGGPGPPSQETLPPGTFGQRRDAAGRPLRPNVVIDYGESGIPTPKLPRNIPVNRLITVPAASPGGPNFRVLAIPTRDQPGTTIVAVPLRDVDQTLDRLLVIEVVVVIGVLALLAVLAWFVVRLGLRPLDRIASTAGAIAGGDLSRRVEPANERTEVGRLGLALNAMLAQIERAFRAREASENRLRRFLADASHELRTPLTAIRGYAELFRMGAVRDSAKSRRAMRRIEEEAERMGDLVENLLVLARLDQLPAVAREPVDLAELAADAVEDARAGAPDRRIELESDQRTVVSGDPSQLRQVVSNLVRNALVHTPAGSPIEVSAVRQDGSGILRVRDHGPGLPGSDPDLLFERFWRADAGRGRESGGAGLGLSIVAAIVSAHGGSVSAEEAGGGGALFTVRLPTGDAGGDAAEAEEPAAPLA